MFRRHLRKLFPDNMHKYGIFAAAAQIVRESACQMYSMSVSTLPTELSRPKVAIPPSLSLVDM